MTSMPEGRPKIPERDEYGPAPGETKGEPLHWDAVEGWLEQARYYWIACTRKNGSPHVVAVWGLWLEKALYYTSNPETLHARILERNPHAIAHPEDAKQAVIIEGLVEKPPPSSLQAAAEAYEARLGWRMDPADPGMPFYALRPSLIRAWWAGDVRNTATSWRFMDG